MADGTIFDTLDVLHIDTIAARMAIELPGSEDAPLGDLLTDELVGRAIAEFFADCGDWNDELTVVALREYRAAQGLNALARDMANSLLASFAPGWA